MVRSALYAKVGSLGFKLHVKHSKPQPPRAQFQPLVTARRLNRDNAWVGMVACFVIVKSYTTLCGLILSFVPDMQAVVHSLC